jgi:hypothetical protein
VNEFRRTALGIAGSLALVGAVAGVTYGVATVVDVGTSDSETRVQETVAPGATTVPTGEPRPSATPASEKTREVGGLLQTANRDHLALCVEAVNVANALAIETAAVPRVQDAVDKVMEHPDWAKIARAPGLAEAPAQIVSGCVSPPVALDPEAGPVFTEFVVDHVGRSVDQASPYLFHVYILPAEEIFRIVGPSENYHWGAEELICYGDDCEPVTWGLYFSPDEVEDPDLIAREIEFVIGLR